MAESGRSWVHLQRYASKLCKPMGKVTHRVQLYLGSLCHFMIEVTLPTLGLLCHHEDDGAQAIGCLVHRLAPALRVRPPRTVTRCKQCVLGCPIPASTHVD